MAAEDYTNIPMTSLPECKQNGCHHICIMHQGLTLHRGDDTSGVEERTASVSRRSRSAVKMLFLCFIHSVLFSLSCGFNVDMDTMVIHHGDQRGSMFGYTVAQYIDKASRRLLIGAPLAQTGQVGIQQGGGVYTCPVYRGNCYQVEFDRDGNTKVVYGSQYIPIEDKSNQWFGATLAADDSGAVVACAPRYVYLTKAGDSRLLVGKCHVAANLTQPSISYSPCMLDTERRLSTSIDQQDRFGRCQSGFSATLSLDGHRVLIGAVGSWLWQGQAYVYSTTGRRRSIHTPEGPSSDDGSYLGYSSTVGKFDADDLDDYAVGVPRGENGLGRVILFTTGLREITELVGEQYGGYFGHSLAVGDFNGDGLDDVAVAAPFYFDRNADKSIEQGRVYIFYPQEREFISPINTTIDGPSSHSRFGMALTSLKDINLDGFDDLAIGAPYAGEHGRGEVYLYHGSAEGIMAKPAQVLKAAEIDTELSTFGFSLAAGRDMDGNDYPDLLVGAYKSERAVAFRSRPIVRVNVTQRMVPKLVDLDRKDCVLYNKTRVSCFTVKTCMSFDGVNVPDKLVFNALWTMDAQNKYSKRAYFVIGITRETKRTKTIFLDKHRKWCDKNLKVYLKDEPLIRDKLTPIVSKFKYELSDDSLVVTDGLKPILNMYSPNPIKSQVHIQKECGSDNICHPDLRLTATFYPDVYVMGARGRERDKPDKIGIRISIDNRREGAYEAMLYVNLTGRVQYNKVTFLGKQPLSASCDAEALSLDNLLVICKIGNPFKSKTGMDLLVQVTPAQIASESIYVHAKVNSTNAERKRHLHSNEQHMEIPITARAKIRLTGGSRPEQITFSTQNSTGTLKLIHIYDLRNLGPSTIRNVAWEVLWPSHDDNGVLLLPLADNPEVAEGKGACSWSLVTPNNASLFSKQFWVQNTPARLGEGEQLLLPCSGGWCTLIHCNIGPMLDDDTAIIKIKSSVSVHTLIQSMQQRHLMIVSTSIAKIVTMDYNITVDTEKLQSAAYQVDTSIIAEDVKAPSERVPIWIIIIAVSAGILLLILIIVLFWKCGFFKRKRPQPEAPDSDLVKNGNIDKK